VLLYEIYDTEVLVLVLAAYGHYGDFGKEAGLATCDGAEKLDFSCKKGSKKEHR